MKCNYEMWTMTIALTTKESSLQGIIKCGKKVESRGRTTGRFRAERWNDVSQIIDPSDYFDSAWEW